MIFLEAAPGGCFAGKHKTGCFAEVEMWEGMWCLLEQILEMAGCVWNENNINGTLPSSFFHCHTMQCFAALCWALLASLPMQSFACLHWPCEAFLLFAYLNFVEWIRPVNFLWQSGWSMLFLLTPANSENPCDLHRIKFAATDKYLLLHNRLDRWYLDNWRVDLTPENYF